MASALLEKYGNAIQSLALIPSGGGVYEVIKNDNLIFSIKAEEDSFSASISPLDIASL